MRSVTSSVALQGEEELQRSVEGQVQQGMDQLTSTMGSLLPSDARDFVGSALSDTEGPRPASSLPAAALPSPAERTTPTVVAAGTPAVLNPFDSAAWTGGASHSETETPPPTPCTAGLNSNDPDPVLRAYYRGQYVSSVLYGSQQDPCVTLYCRNAPVGECQHIPAPDNPRPQPTCESVASQLLAHLPSQTRGDPAGYTREAAVAAVCAPQSHTVDSCQPGGTLQASVCHLNSTFCALDDECRSRMGAHGSSSPATSSGVVDVAAIETLVANASHVDHPHHLRDILHSAAAIAENTVGCTLRHIPHGLSSGGLPVLGTDAIGCLSSAMRDASGE